MYIIYLLRIMWAHFNYVNYPIVEVLFDKNIENENEFKEFLETWLELYKKKKNFSFIFDTCNVGCINISYCSKLKNFINDLKKLPKQYLKNCQNNI